MTQEFLVPKSVDIQLVERWIVDQYGDERRFYLHTGWGGMRWAIWRNRDGYEVHLPDSDDRATLFALTWL